MSEDPTPATVKRLFAESGNRCAYPSCNQLLVDADGAIYADICHITARRPGGPRYDPAIGDEARRSYENLLLMCRIHHIRVDGQATAHLYSVAQLRDYKRIRAELTRNSGQQFIASPEQIDHVIKASGVNAAVSVSQQGGQTAGTIINNWTEERSSRQTGVSLATMFDDLSAAIDDGTSLQSVLSKARRIALHLSTGYWEHLFTMHLQGDFTLLDFPKSPDNDPAAQLRIRAEFDASWDRAADSIRDPSEDLQAFLSRLTTIKFCGLRPPEIRAQLVEIAPLARTSVEVAKHEAVLRRVEKRIWRRVHQFSALVQERLGR